MRSRLVARVDDQDPVGALAARSRKQFSATGPTVSISTSRLNSRSRCADPGPLPFPPHRHVDVVAGRDVEDEHEGAEDERRGERPFEEDAGCRTRRSPRRRARGCTELRQVGGSSRFAAPPAVRRERAWAFASARLRGLVRGVWCRSGRPGFPCASCVASSWSGPRPKSNRSGGLQARRSIVCRAGSKPRIGTSSG